MSAIGQKETRGNGRECGNKGSMLCLKMSVATQANMLQ